MTPEEICAQVVASDKGEAFFKCLTLVPDPTSHPHFFGPLMVGILLGAGIMTLIVAAATVGR